MIDVRPPDPNWKNREGWGDDPDAQKEEKNFGRLEELEKAKHAVKLAIQKVLLLVVPISIGLAVTLFWIGIVIYAIHLFTPFRWLKPEDLDTLKTILFSSVAGGVVSHIGRRYID